MRKAIVALAAVFLASCSRQAANDVAANNALAGNEAAEAPANDRIEVILTRVTDHEPWDRLSIAVGADGRVVTERRRYFYGEAPGTEPREEAVRRDVAQISPERAADFRRALAELGPTLARGGDIRLKSMPGCPLPSHFNAVVEISFEAPDGRAGGFALDSMCHHPDAARARAIVEWAIEMLPSSNAAQGFTY